MEQKDNIKGESWISIKEIIKAADLQSVYRQRSRSSSDSSDLSIPSEDPNITIDWTRNSFGINGENSYGKKDPGDIFVGNTLNCNTNGTFRYSTCTNDDIWTLGNSYNRNIESLKEKLAKGNELYTMATNEILKLKKYNKNLQEDYKKQMVYMKEQYENYLVNEKEKMEKEFNNKIGQIKSIHREEIHKTGQKWEELTKKLKNIYDLEIEGKDSLIKKLSDKLLKNKEMRDQEWCHEECNKKICKYKKNQKIIQTLNYQLDEQKLIIESQKRIIEGLNSDLFRLSTKTHKSMQNEASYQNSDLISFFSKLNNILETADNLKTSDSSPKSYKCNY
ncbi:unnamed protein product [Blepharisma stoltei]|uniref:Uncharacterized protein n=1 Tax=Blepharisma stoltei TaxID=1481888 RepID=A0AAU9IDY8_9CILI|nr:unnamed protein product [Blepharisma stoltei]